MSAQTQIDAAPGGELVELLAQLVGIESLSGAEANVQDFIQRWFAEQGIPTRRISAADGLTNVIVEIDGAGDGPTLWIGGHCDTVGVSGLWESGPFTPTIRDGRLYARGAMDMKGGLSAAMITTRDMYRRRDTWFGRLVFASLADEEAYSRGAEAYVAECGRISGAIMCEPHFDDVVIGAIGKANIDVLVRGRAAHASHPDLGVNAVVEAGRLLAKLGDLKRPADPVFGAPTQCVIGIDSGDGAYSISVPDRCRFLINWHFLPDERPEDAVELLQGMVDELRSPAAFDITIKSPCYEGYLINKEDPFVVEFAGSYRKVLGQEPRLEIGRGVSDANILAGRAGIPTLLFGPSGGNMHGVNEWVDVSELERAQAVYADFAQRYLRAPVS